MHLGLKQRSSSDQMLSLPTSGVVVPGEVGILRIPAYTLDYTTAAHQLIPLCVNSKHCQSCWIDWMLWLWKIVLDINSIQFYIAPKQ